MCKFVTNLYGEKILVSDMYPNMDREIVWQIFSNSNQDLFDKYAERHFTKYGKKWKLDEENSVYEVVENEYGVTLYYNVAVSLMDDDLRNEVASDIAPCTAQEFFDEYCKRHKEKFGEEFELAKPNPCY